jgi:alpha-glucosidase (family GH31 glycosyl hydrolase)
MIKRYSSTVWTFEKVCKAVLCTGLFFTATALAAQQPDSDYAVSVSAKEIRIASVNKTLLLIDSIRFNHVSPASQKVLYNNGDSVLIELRYNQVPEFNMIDGLIDRVVNLTVTRKNGAFHFFAHPAWADQFTLYITDRGDHYFGLAEGLYPDNRKSPDLRGQTVDVDVAGQQFRIQENFTSVWSAFYFNPKGYASFINTFARGRYQLGVNGRTSIAHETGKLDWHVFTGTPDKIYRDYYNVIGKPKKVPLWSCGPMVWRDENRGGSAEILDDAKKFSRLQIPLTSLMVDRPYSNGAHLWSKMDFGPTFSNPHTWIKTLDSVYGLNFITWIAPATFADKDFPGLLPGSFGYIDLTNPQAIAAFGNRLKTAQYAHGVKGHKMDRADEAFPAQEAWQDGTSEPERRNKYVYLYAKITDSILDDALGTDHLNYARAAYHGSQQYLSGIWGGDPRSGWDGMAGNMANAVRASFLAFPNWGTDVGGYLGPTGTIPDTLYIRWLQWGAFNGLFEIKIDGAGGGGTDRAPWHCSPAVQDAFRTACEQRMSWMPHIFSQLNTSATHGPLMKPLAMVYPDDTATYAIWDEYIFGNALLVAPLFSAATKREVYLPAGEWLNYHTMEKSNGNQTITANAPLSSIPMYIKSNSFLVQGNVYQGNKKLWTKGRKPFVDILFYPGRGTARFDFVDPQKNNEVVAFSAICSSEKISLAVPAISYMGKLKIFTAKKPARITRNGKAIKAVYSKNYVVLDRVLHEDANVEITF